MLKSCICGDKKIKSISQKCYNCKFKFEIDFKADKRSICPIHKPLIFCGKKPFLCDVCTTQGWVSYGGNGGASYIKNTFTNDIRH